MANPMYRVSINGFWCHNETWDDAFNWDGKHDEVFLDVNTKVASADGTISQNFDSESELMGDTWRLPGRVQAGSASDRGGIVSGDKFPWNQPWNRQNGLNTTVRVPPYTIWEGELRPGRDLIFLTPTIWEWDPGQGAWDGWLAWLAQVDTKYGQRAKDIFSKTWPVSAPVFDAVSLGIQTTASLAGLWSPAGKSMRRPIGMRRDPNNPDGSLFNPITIALNSETGDYLAGSNLQGYGNGIVELRYVDDPYLRGVYSMFVQIERLNGSPPPSAGNQAWSDPVAYVTPFDSTARIVHRSQGNLIQELYYLDASGWGSGNLSTLSGAPAAAGRPFGYVTETDATARVVFRATDNHVHELYYRTGQGWHHGSLSALSGATPAAGDPYAYFTPFDSFARVVYRSGDGHIHELAHRSGAGWSHADLTAITGAPAAVDDPAAYVTSADETAHVVYRGGDGHVHELAYRTGPGWGHTDLTATTGAPPAKSAPMGYETPFDSTGRVVYRGQDDHIHELYSVSGQGWGHGDLSALSGSGTAAGKPFGYVTEADGTARVVFRGGDEHIHELYYLTGQGWQHEDLSALSGATPAAGDPYAYVTPFDSFARVAYRSSNGRIHELYYKTGQGWGHAQLT